MKRCTQCGKQFDDGKRFCTFCGGCLEDINQALFCVNCGKRINADSRFCDFCGAKVEKVNTMQKQTPETKISRNSVFSLLQPKFLAVIAVLLVVVVCGAGYLLFGGKPAGPKVEAVKLPTDISKIDKTKTTPVFNPDFERVVNYKRKVIADPVFVRTNKTQVKVFDKPEGKIAGDLSQGTLCEVGDYKDTKSGTWLYLRLIQVVNGKKDTPASGWIRESDADIDLQKSVVFKFTEEGIKKPAGNYRLVYKALGNTKDFNHNSAYLLLSYNRHNAVFIDIDSITKDGKYIFFSCISVDQPDNATTFSPVDYSRRATYRFDTKSRFIRQIFAQVPLQDDGMFNVKWVKDANGIYYNSSFGNRFISPPGDLITNGFLRVLEGH